MLSVFDENTVRTLHENSIRKEAWNEGRNDGIAIGEKSGRNKGIMETISILRNMGVDESILSKAIASAEAQSQGADA